MRIVLLYISNILRQINFYCVVRMSPSEVISARPHSILCLSQG